MITELSKNEFYRCKGLINEDGHVEVKAVIEGVNPARIFVDDRFSPRTGFIWLGNNDGFFFIGDNENDRFNREIGEFFARVIIPDAKKVGLEWFEGFGTHQKWNPTIEKIFEHYQIDTWNQKVYQLQRENYTGKKAPNLKPGYSVMEIHEALNQQSHFQNIEFLNSKLLSFWSSLEDFKQSGIGYCAVYQNNIVSVCFSGFVADNVHCIDIATLKDHRGQKLAQHLAQCFVRECMEKGKIPYWDCMEGNKPSVAIAENLGFKNVFNYVGYEFPFQ
jgi:GNAT superfamily N-acetyltransferase